MGENPVVNHALTRFSEFIVLVGVDLSSASGRKLCQGSSSASFRSVSELDGTEAGRVPTAAHDNVKPTWLLRCLFSDFSASVSKNLPGQRRGGFLPQCFWLLQVAKSVTRRCRLRFGHICKTREVACFREFLES